MDRLGASKKTNDSVLKYENSVRINITINNPIMNPRRIIKFLKKIITDVLRFFAKYISKHKITITLINEGNLNNLNPGKT